MGTHTAVFGVYRNENEVKMAIRSLKRCGFKLRQITHLNRHRSGARDIAYLSIQKIQKGAFIGTCLGFIISLAYVAMKYFFDDYEVNLHTVTGANLSQSVLGSWFTVMIGTILGSAAGVLVSIGTPRKAIDRYRQYIQSGGILLAVDADNAESIGRAHRVLEKTGAQDINSLAHEQGLAIVQNA